MDSLWNISAEAKVRKCGAILEASAGRLCAMAIVTVWRHIWWRKDGGREGDDEQLAQEKQKCWKSSANHNRQGAFVS